MAGGGQHLQETAASPGLLPLTSLAPARALLRLVVVVVVTCVTRGWARVGEGRQRVGGGLRLLPSSTLYTSHNTHHRLPHHRPAQHQSHTAAWADTN